MENQIIDELLQIIAKYEIVENNTELLNIVSKLEKVEIYE